MPFVVTLGNVTVPGVSNVSYTTHREPNRESGELGQDGFNIESIRIDREIHLDAQNNGKAENDIIKLVAKVGNAAYFKGEIKILHPNDLDNAVKTLRWERGHVCAYSNSVSEQGGTMRITQSLSVSVTKEVTENDGKFRRPGAQ